MKNINKLKNSERLKTKKYLMNYNMKNNKIDFGLGIGKGNSRVKSNKARPLFDLRVTNKNKSQLPKSKRPYHSFAKVNKMNWNQVNKRFPGLNPMGDIDFDGTRNKFDCKPFDPSRDGIFGRIANIVTGGKKGQSKEDYQKERVAKKERSLGKKIIRDQERRAIKERAREVLAVPIKISKKVEKESGRDWRAAKRIVRITGKETLSGAGQSYKRTGSAVRKAVGDPDKVKGKKGKSGKKYVSAGRPKGQYKTRINPFSGQPIQIPATEFYKLKKKYKQAVTARAQATSQQVDVAQTRALARRGIPPQIAQKLVDQRQLQSVGYEPEQETQIQAPEQQITEQPVEDTTMADKMARLRAMKQIKQSQVQPQPQQQVPIQQLQQAPQQIQQQYPPQSPQQVPVKYKKDIMTGRIIAKPMKKREQWTIPRRFRRVII